MQALVFLTFYQYTTEMENIRTGFSFFLKKNYKIVCKSSLSFAIRLSRISKHILLIPAALPSSNCTNTQNCNQYGNHDQHYNIWRCNQRILLKNIVTGCFPTCAHLLVVTIKFDGAISEFFVPLSSFPAASLA